VAVLPELDDDQRGPKNVASFLTFNLYVSMFETNSNKVTLKR
jgi:hypothetical protein